jgi:hypothetical protein
MKAILNKAWKILLIVVIGCSFVSCELTQREFDRFDTIIPPENRGALIIQLSAGVPNAATLTPPISVKIYNYDIYGDGPNPPSDHFEYLGIQEVELSETNLTPGTWTIRVDARNQAIANDDTSNGTIIARGETDVLIIPNQVSTAQIEVKPIADPLLPGTLNLTVEWTKGTIADPVMQASLKAAGSSDEIIMPFIQHPPGNPESFIFEKPLDLQAGYYFLILRLLNGEELLWGTAEAVRIIAGQATSQVYQAD